MISHEQCKHVIQYYIMKMSMDDSFQVAPHIQRDCVYLNKMRGELCANISSNPILTKIVHLLHTSKTIDQVNSVPIDSVCYGSKW